ncbi:arsenate reductase ArsC [Acinetobacter junii]|uniref:Arsenate reductase ArsC n=1 Tax=Acinetobacter junii TaxID=40215 RepID=A0AAX1MJ75_ACIJU|nr:arsenate reductase ArsC [Acinetobacter junii]QUY37105.1 arsenate reductase ArsC [Acinetobacter junii]
MKFLFLCTGNSCRSILSEVLFNHRAPAGWKAYSAGSKPSGQVHPLTIETLESLNLSTEGLWSKTIDDCEQYQPDVVITVCDSAAQEACPLYLGGAIKAHWGLADPSHLDLPKEDKLKAFQVTVDHINRRLDALFAMDTESMTRPELIAAINKISEIE